jgi:hypothetical protein
MPVRPKRLASADGQDPESRPSGGWIAFDQSTNIRSSVSHDAPTRPSSDDRDDAAGPWSSTWVRHYDRASRRRHHAGGNKKIRREAKRRRRYELAIFLALGLAVAVVFSIFTAILSR